MTNKEIKQLCKDKEHELLKKYYGNLRREAAVERPETIGIYTKDLPQIIATEYRKFLEEQWEKFAPEDMKGEPLVLEETELLELMTEADRERMEEAYKDAKEITLWEFFTQTNYKDVTYYKALLKEYTRTILLVMRCDFLEEITGEYILNKTFEDD